LGHQALFDKQQAHKKKMMEFVDRFGAKASKAKQAQSRLRAIERMDMVDALIAERSTSFKFPQPEQISSPIITMDDVDVGYEAGKPILRKINIGLAGDDRVALLGANGNGKSTLVKLISDNLSAMTGQVTRNSKLRIGYFAQHQSDELDDETTPYEAMRKAIGDIAEAKCRALLGKFGFDKGKSDTQIRKLSGGEKARLLFCIMSHDAPHIMLLDEPTNHLDIDARQALIEALNGYEGCVILVSHDPHLVEAVAERLYLVRDAGVAPYEGDLDAYRGLIMEQRREERAQARKSKKTQKAKPAAKTDTAKAEKLEAELAKFTAQKTELEAAMSHPDAMADSAKMEQLLAEYAQVETQIGETEKAWFDTQG
jgi:ATP-binding cassette subfamily F protein 3